MEGVLDITQLGEVWTEFFTAYMSTGMSPALEKAKERLPILLSMKPETVEAYFALRYPEV